MGASNAGRCRPFLQPRWCFVRLAPLLLTLQLGGLLPVADCTVATELQAKVRAAPQPRFSAGNLSPGPVAFAPYLPSLAGKLSASLHFTVRVEGFAAVPFTPAIQAAIIRAINGTISKAFGAVLLLRYKEGLAANGDSDNGTIPYVDIRVRVWDNSVEDDSTTGEFDQAHFSSARMFSSFLAFVVGIRKQGLDVQVRLMAIENAPADTALEFDALITTSAIRQLRLTLALCAWSEAELHWAASTVLNTLRDRLLHEPGSVPGDGDGRPAVSVTALGASALASTGCSFFKHSGESSTDDNGYSSGVVVGVQFYVEIAIPACPAPTNSTLLVEGGDTWGPAAEWLPGGDGAEGYDAVCNVDPAWEVEAALVDVESWLLAGTDAGVRLVALESQPALDEDALAIEAQAESVAISTSSQAADDGLPRPISWLHEVVDLSEPARLSAGSGVNIYLLSSGVRATHAEFSQSCSKPTPSNSSRVRPLWGIEGDTPLQDCSDAAAWHGIGTYGASLISGCTLGVAPNATIYSVKFRHECLQGADIWQPGALPSAMDAVLTAFQPPGVMVVDTWWSPSRLLGDDDEHIASEIRSRLNLAESRNIPIVVQAGGSVMLDACDNVFANRSGTILVSSVNSFGVRSTGAPGNSSCIDLWAKGGDLGDAVRGASSAGDETYIDVIPLDAGGLYRVAGAVARHLQNYPDTTSHELKTALQQQALKGTLWDVGGSPNSLAVTNATVGDDSLTGDDSQTGSTQAMSSAEGADTDSGIKAWLVAVIATVVSCMLLLLAIAVFVVVRRRRARTGHGRVNYSHGSDEGGFGNSRSGSLLGPFISSRAASDSNPGGTLEDGSGASGGQRLWNSISEGLHPSPSAAKASGFTQGPRVVPNLDTLEAPWLLEAYEIDLEPAPNGTRKWLLGSGNFSQVYRGTKGGVQPVAVKIMARSPTIEAIFYKEATLMHKICHDPNIVQFYGGVVTERNVAIAMELMEGGDMRSLLDNTHKDMVRWHNFGKSVAIGVVRGLVHMHKHGLAHRDIKSKNIFIGRDGTAKIGDIGLAKGLRDGLLTQDNALGTFAWAAPEVLLNKPCGLSVDIYSYGVLLWEIVTTEQPIRAAMRPVRVPSECPQKVADLIKECMAEDPRQRPTAQQVYQALKKCEPIEPSEWDPYLAAKKVQPSDYGAGPQPWTSPGPDAGMGPATGHFGPTCGPGPSPYTAQPRVPMTHWQQQQFPPPPQQPLGAGMVPVRLGFQPAFPLPNGQYSGQQHPQPFQQASAASHTACHRDGPVVAGIGHLDAVGMGPIKDASPSGVQLCRDGNDSGLMAPTSSSSGMPGIDSSTSSSSGDEHDHDHRQPHPGSQHLAEWHSYQQHLQQVRGEGEIELPCSTILEEDEGEGGQASATPAQQQAGWRRGPPPDATVGPAAAGEATASAATASPGPVLALRAPGTDLSHAPASPIPHGIVPQPFVAGLEPDMNGTSSHAGPSAPTPVMTAAAAAGAAAAAPGRNSGSDDAKSEAPVFGGVGEATGEGNWLQGIEMEEAGEAAARLAARGRDKISLMDLMSQPQLSQMLAMRTEEARAAAASATAAAEDVPEAAGTGQEAEDAAAGPQEQPARCDPDGTACASPAAGSSHAVQPERRRSAASDASENIAAADPGAAAAAAVPSTADAAPDLASARTPAAVIAAAETGPCAAAAVTTTAAAGDVSNPGADAGAGVSEADAADDEAVARAASWAATNGGSSTAEAAETSTAGEADESEQHLKPVPKPQHKWLAILHGGHAGRGTPSDMPFYRRTRTL